MVQASSLDCNTEFISPDAVRPCTGRGLGFQSTTGRLNAHAKATLSYRLWPDFIIELTSPSDRLRRVMAKMVQWIGTGATLGWLLDAHRRIVYVCRPKREPEELVGVDHVIGEGPVSGLRLDFAKICRGLPLFI